MVKFSHSKQSRIFFIGCNHWGHKKIIEYTNRPFKTVEEMNEAMISNWNSVVGKNDKVIHLGDVIFNRGEIDPSQVLNRLNGDIYLAIGNHDDVEKLIRSSHKIVLARDILDIKVNDQNIVCCHYPMKSWNRAYYGSYMVHAHTHLSFPTPDDELIFNASVEWIDYTPLSFDQLTQVMLPKREKFLKKQQEREEAKNGTQR